MGVNTHLFYNDTPYADIDTVAARLQQLGIMHIRDGFAPGRPDEIAALNLLASDGIKSDLLVGSPGTDPASLLDTIQSQLSGSVEAIEGPNEYSFTGDGWQARLLPFQATLDQEVHSILPGVPVVGSSVTGVNLVGSLDIGNMHPYPGGAAPEPGLAANITLAQAVSGSAPLWATETGYHDAVNMTPGTNQPATTDAEQALYLPRLFAYYYSQGVQRTYIYELLDEFSDPTRSSPEDDFGLLNNNLTPKPQFYALENLTTAIRDIPDPDPTPLNYSVSDTGSGLQQLLLSRADGSWQILVWRAEPVNAAGQAATADAEIQLPFCSDVTSESPSQSADIESVGTGTNFVTSVGPGLQILTVKRDINCGSGQQTAAVVLTASGEQASAALPTSSGTASAAAPGVVPPVPGTTRKASALSRSTTSGRRLWGLSSGRVAIEFRIAQMSKGSPRIKHVRFRLPNGLSFRKLGHGSAIPASAGTVAAKGSTIVVNLREAARTLRIYVRPGAIREDRNMRARARRGGIRRLTVHLTIVGSQLTNSELNFVTKDPR